MGAAVGIGVLEKDSSSIISDKYQIVGLLAGQYNVSGNDVLRINAGKLGLGTSSNNGVYAYGAIVF